MKGFSDGDRKEIEEGARVLIDEERTLRDLRRASDLVDEELADLAGITVEAIAQAERVLEMKVASIGRFVEAMGGEVQLVARFPGRSQVAFSLADLFPLDASGEHDNKDVDRAERLRMAS
ncbi:MAG: hypothetical protein ACTHQE_02945 [Thermomicrobiales bacterium]